MKKALERAGLASVLISVALTACASSQQTDGKVTAAGTNTAPDARREWTTPDRETTIRVSEDVRKRCNLPDTTVEAPGFDYDQAALQEQSRRVLDEVATCLRNGALSDQAITLVGRADPRGTEVHNDALGANRAAAARDYLTQRGVPAGRIHLASRGEHGARGTDEETFALDRRVDVELGDVRKHPIIEGTMKQVETSRARQPNHPEAASYADTAEGGKPVGASGSDASGASAPSSPPATGQVQGSASGSVKAGTTK